jgi:hypothetical protein
MDKTATRCCELMAASELAECPAARAATLPGQILLVARTAASQTPEAAESTERSATVVQSQHGRPARDRHAPVDDADQAHQARDRPARRPMETSPRDASDIWYLGIPALSLLAPHWLESNGPVINVANVKRRDAPRFCRTKLLNTTEEGTLSHKWAVHYNFVLQFSPDVAAQVDRGIQKSLLPQRTHSSHAYEQRILQAC